MAAKIVRGWSAGGHYGDSDVSALAHQAADRGVVSEYGHAGTHWFIFRHGHLQANIILRDGFHCQARFVAVSEPVRGRRLLRQF